MSPIGAMCVGVAAVLLLRRRRLEGGAMLAVSAWSPAAAALVVGLGLVFWARRSVTRRRVNHRVGRDGALLFVELVAMALAAGQPLQAAVATARERAPAVGTDVDRLLHDTRRRGAAAALSSAEGQLAPFFRSVARAMSTGAPVAAVASGFAGEMRKERSAQEAAAIRRLPVRLLIPLTLLILPGFVVLTLGPAVSAGLDHIMKGDL